MTTTTDKSMIAFGSKILGLLDEASFSTTYKFAVLLALIDRVSEGVSARGRAPGSLRTSSVAERVFELYWPQTAPFERGESAVRLSQSGRGEAAIVRRLSVLREKHSIVASAPAVRVKQLPEYPKLLSDVEFTVANMPLPRLQRPYPPFIYEIDWDEKTLRKTYFSKDRKIQLLPGAGANLVRLGPLLRPLLEQKWMLTIGRFNMGALDESRLHRFLFQPQRVRPKKLLVGLTALQNGKCFYCRKPMAKGHIDHFIPWSHSMDEGIDNLVLACHPCNLSKSAHRPAAAHVKAWSARLKPRRQKQLASLAAQHGWEKDIGRTVGLARSSYLALPNGTRLWRSTHRFSEIADERSVIEDILGTVS
jgi:5-methylcytosine-specific restriction endonuclease McrA